MRKLSVLMILLAAGCDGTGGGAASPPAPTDTWLVVDDARIAPDNAGVAWCASGAEPGVFVVVHVAGTHGSTDVASPGLTPRWNEAILEADDAPFAAGATIEVGGDCDGHRFTIGEMQARLRDENTLTAFGGVAWLRLYLDRTPAGSAPDGSGPSGAVIAGGVGSTGGGYVGGDGSGDTGSPGDPGDSGVGDTGNSGVGDTSDPGQGDVGGDPGDVGDPGDAGDPDDGGDDGCDGCDDGDYRAPRHAHPKHQQPRHAHD
jgi:hypothetical protein